LIAYFKRGSFLLVSLSRVIPRLCIDSPAQKTAYNSIVESFEVVRGVSRTDCNNAILDTAEETKLLLAQEAYFAMRKKDNLCNNIGG
jgi:hypothetical protein